MANQNENNMKTMQISQDQIYRAENLYKFKELKNSITKGEGNTLGALGEVIIQDLYSKSDLQIDVNSTYDYDLIIGNYKIDVKTKSIKVKPNSKYLCSVSGHNPNQKCDYYFFLGIDMSLNLCYLYGYKSKEDFFNEAFYKGDGEIDDTGYHYKSSWNLEISKLKEFKII